MLVSFKQDNMLMLGAWFGVEKKPDFRVFLKPLAAQMNKLRIPFQVETPSGAVQASFRLLTKTADNPAKEDIINYLSTTCGICQQAPVFVANVNGVATIPTFPKLEQPAVMRTTLNILQDSVAAHQVRAPSHGIKGPVPMIQFQGVDLVLPLDYQHNFCLRVMAKLLELWFGEANGGKPFSRRDQVRVFDRKMTDTRPPEFISRQPQPYSKIKYWKAVEYRNVLLYYGPLVLKGVVTDAQYRHFMLLSAGLAIFLGQSISPAQRQLAQGMLNKFVGEFAALYGQRFMSKTVHSLLHVEYCVLKTGPLWATSCFPFESIYHHLLKMIHGTQYVLEQVCSSVFSEKRRAVCEQQVHCGGCKCGS